MNWKKAGGILITLGITATACYLSYSFVFNANKKDFEAFKLKIKNSELIKQIDPEKEIKMIKKVHNLSKKQLIRLSELINKKYLVESENKEIETLKTKWNYE